jgi:hypothetical protein
MIDKRAARRERVFKAGKLSFGCERVNCTVRNLSVTGAMIEVQNSDDMPHEIILDILSSGARFPVMSFGDILVGSAWPSIKSLS